MRAVIACVDVCAMAFEKLFEMQRNSLVIFNCEVAARDPRLVGDHYHGNECRIDSRDCVGRAVNQLHLVRSREIVRVLDYRPVAVEEYRRGKSVQFSVRMSTSMSCLSKRSGTDLMIIRATQKKRISGAVTRSSVG